MKTALLSVSDKTGIVDFAQKLVSFGFQIVSTGGTHRVLKEAGVAPLKDVQEITNFPEGLEGRIKTLHPKVFGGVLALRNDKSHTDFCEKHELPMIDMVVVNLYPFRATYEDESKTFEEIVEKIDIGGPSMIRAAAKNYAFCAPVVDPRDYDQVVAEYEANGDLTMDFRKKLAAKTFAMTAHYDMLIAKFWHENADVYPLRYGENPHQKGVAVADPFGNGPSLMNAEVLNGKQLSFNNLYDASGALELALSFGMEKPFAAIIKHAAPCGAALGETIEDAFDKALACDSTSAFGGIMAVNRPVTKELAEKMIGFFNEIVMAPEYTPEGLEVLKQKKNLRVLKIAPWEQSRDYVVKAVRGGVIMQNLDDHVVKKEDVTVVTKEKPTDSQMEDMMAAWKMVKLVKSNGIVLVKDGMMVGKGTGQTSRVEAMNIAIRQAGEKAKGAVVASDAFFPFADSIELAKAAGIAAVVQPGGSRNDQLVIDEADKSGISMVFTNHRAFLH